MVCYSLQYEHRVQKDLRKLDKTAVKRIMTAVDALAENPYPNASKQLVGSDLRSLRIGTYRVIYAVKEEIITVLVLRIGHRKEGYKL